MSSFKPKDIQYSGYSTEKLHKWVCCLGSKLLLMYVW